MAFNLGDALKAVSYPDTGREQIEYIRLERIEEDPNNFYKPSDIDQLAANIELCGLQQPIRVRPIEGTDRYMIVSGHRRRKAIEMLAKENSEKWSEVSCIVERDEASPALQQLRLIFANANTRTMTAAEISEQAEQVKNLLYKLKEEEGYEFPGRMRDHVAEVVGVSKSKLARLKVIRDDLGAEWRGAWEGGTLAENTAYELAKMPLALQTVLFEEKSRTNANLKYLYTEDVKKFAERAEVIEKQNCSLCGGPCTNYDNKLRKAAVSDRYYGCPCVNGCCAECREYLSCKRCCPNLSETVKKLKADAKAEAKAAAEAQALREKPETDQINALWQRFGLAREMTGLDFKDYKEAVGMRYFGLTDDVVMALECGEGKVATNTRLPYDNNCYLDSIQRLIKVADLFGCSIDWLFCRTDVKELATKAVPESDREEKEPEYIMGAWYPVTVEPPVGVPLALIDSDGYVDDGKYTGSGVFKQYGDCPVIMWTLMPSEKDAATFAPASTGWRSGTPEGYGTYAAYVKVAGAANPMLRELLWTGDEWLMFGQKISDDVTVQCWADRPEL